MDRQPHTRLAAGALAALAVAALAALAAPAHAADLAPEWRGAAGLGLSLATGNEDFQGVAVRVEAERALRVLSPRARLSLVVALGASHPSATETVPIAYDPFLGTYQTAEVTWDANVFDLVPAARVTWDVTPTTSFFADGGLGIAYTVATAGVPPQAAALGISGGPSDGIAASLRLAGGFLFTPTPAVRIGLQLVGLHARFGDGVGTSFDLLAFVSHRL